MKRNRKTILIWICFNALVFNSLYLKCKLGKSVHRMTIYRRSKQDMIRVTISTLRITRYLIFSSQEIAVYITEKSHISGGDLGYLGWCFVRSSRVPGHSGLSSRLHPHSFFLLSLLFLQDCARETTHCVNGSWQPEQQADARPSHLRNTSWLPGEDAQKAKTLHTGEGGSGC